MWKNEVGLKGTDQLFHHKIWPEADKILPFSSDLVLLWQSNFYHPNLRDFRYTEASGHTADVPEIQIDLAALDISQDNI